MNTSGGPLNDLAWAAGTFIATAAASVATNYYVLGEWRRTSGQHWTERARSLFHARFTGALNFSLFVFGGFLVGGCFTDDFPWAALVGSFLGSIAGAIPVRRAYFPHQTIWSWLSTLAIGLSFRAVALGLFLLCILGMPTALGPKTLLIAGGWMGAQLALDFGLWLWFLRLIRILRIPSSRLARIVAESSAWTGVPVRAVWETRGVICEAVVFRTTRTLVFTTPLVEKLDDDELESICIYELAHLVEGRSAIIRVQVLSVLSRLPLLFLIPAESRLGPGGIAAVLMLFFGLSIARSHLRSRLIGRAEHVAVVSAPDPAVYARALEKVYRANQTPAVLGRWGRVHPNLYDRMMAAGVVPSYPRPKKPRCFHWTSAVLLAMVVAGFVLEVTCG